MADELARIAAAVSVGMAAWLANVDVQAQNLVSNGQFDTGISGWVLSGGGNETSMTWDGTNGSPSPGSLRITSTLVPAQGAIIEVFGDCIDSIPGEVVTVTGQVMKPTAQFGVLCHATLVIFSDVSCTGSRTFTANVPPNTPGIWEETGTAFALPVSGISARPSLTMELGGAGAGEKVCLFDSVVMTSDLRSSPVADIPALSAPGLLVLGLIVVMAAMRRLIHARVSDSR